MSQMNGSDTNKYRSVGSKSTVYSFTLCALFAALTAVCTFINIPLPFTPIPINLATMAVFLSGGLLGPKYGALSQIVYIMIGCIGLPIFSNYQGGVGVLVGPTGGYLAGYILGAFVVGILLKVLTSNKEKNRTYIPKIVLSCIAGMLTYFALGTIWFMNLTNTGLWASLVMCVFPFILGDLLKITAATLLITALRRRIPHLHIT